MSEPISQDPEGRAHARGSARISARPAATLTVQAIFRDVEQQQVQTLAAEMIARAHELANQPECECDVDVSVQSAAPMAPIDEC